MSVILKNAIQIPVMIEAMAVRCAECGYDNNPQYRYCGMCGAPLPLDPPVRTAIPKETAARTSTTVAPPPALPRAVSPPPAAPRATQPPRPVAPVSGPSFLGLDQKSEGSTTYLLEDDEPRSGVGKVVVVLLALALAGGFAYLHFRSHGFPWAGLQKPQSNGEVAKETTSPSGALSSTPPEGPPLSSSGEVPSATPRQPKDEAPISQDLPQKSSSGDSASTTRKPSETSPSPEASNPAPEATSAGPRKHERPAPPVKTAKAIERKPASPAPSKPAVGDSDAANDALVTQGEKYLYGTGAPQNCSLAQKSLSAAASRSNAKAQSMLGTMYATGHCVTRSLPLAYRWFAKALHQDPHNTRISADLEVLWKQMSAEERQLAIGSR